MTTPIIFASSTPRFALPRLFPSQAQKEFIVNEAFARLDALVHCEVAGEAMAPPTEPAEGDNWIVLGPATGEWEGQDGTIASYQSGNWLFFQPRAGMIVWDHSSNQTMAYKQTGWTKAGAVPEPEGGNVVDFEAYVL